MKDERTLYRERTEWPGWLNAVFWGAIVLGAYPLLAGWDTDLPFDTRLLIVGLILAFGVGLKTLLGGMTALVQETRVVVHMGTTRLIRRTVPYSDITAIRSVHYHPIRDFGGWGIRGFGKRKAWTARGDEAVVLSLVGDRELYIGSDYPHRLEARIRAAAGDQIRDDR